MNDFRHRHRKWLDHHMPAEREVRAALRATLDTCPPRQDARRRWPGLLAAAGAAAVAAVIVVGRPPPHEPDPKAIDWRVSLALHVAGQPTTSDVRIKIAVHQEERP